MMPTFEPVVLVDDRCPERLNWYSKFEQVLPDGTKLHPADQLQQAYEAGKRDAVPEWLPMETAPKDCGFLGYQKITPDLWVIVPMYWSGSEYLIIQFHSDNTEHPMKPTRWKPLPAPPKGD